MKKTIYFLIYFLTISFNLDSQELTLDHDYAAYYSEDGLIEFSKWSKDAFKFSDGSFNGTSLNFNNLVLFNADGFSQMIPQHIKQGGLLSDNAFIGSYPGLPNNGYINVMDGSSDVQAGLYVDEHGNGIVFGDSKSFKVTHPLDPEKDIWYACIEGPEAAIYERGSASLQNGEVFISYSEHFASMLGDGKVTVHLTPGHWETLGLSVVHKTNDGFHVKELMGGKGNFSFDWEVKAVRKGKEDFQVIRSKEFLKKLAPTDINTIRQKMKNE